MTVPVDVRDLVRQPGSSRTVRVQEPVEGLATELARVPEDREVHAELLFESVVEGILVSGKVRGTMVVSCARCLKPVETVFDLHVQELFAPGAREEDDQYSLGEGSLDLEPMIRDAVVLAMPFAPLCRPECMGLCARCGGDINEGECSCPPQQDERWAPLRGIEWETRLDRGPGDPA
jgi:uncharacterized protein